MNLRQITPWSKSSSAVEAEPSISTIGRTLALLVEGTALNMPEIDADHYKAFRGNVSRLSQQLTDRLPEDDQLALVRAILHEFETYSKLSEAAIKERVTGWRGLVTLLFQDLLASMGMSAESPEAQALGPEIAGLASGDQLRDWRARVEEFLHPPDADGQAQGLASTKAGDRSTANDNAAGLRGGGSAVERLRKIMEGGGAGFVALFRLSCLDVINQRFGKEAVEDCLMAVSAFLTASLHNDDTIYHWSDSSLLAILQGRPSEQILAAELQRIASQNRDSSINVAGRTIMLRIPLAFDVTPISRLRTPEDLFRLSTQVTTKW